ncbi:MAG TPA: hypothetical protein VG897_16950, partial [Terriglobales bacterium]|nr:hypothetical protein [Terriglobales bacterium]
MLFWKMCDLDTPTDRGSGNSEFICQTTLGTSKTKKGIDLIGLFNQVEILPIAFKGKQEVAIGR